jgi:hypothetical protein
MIRTFYVNVTNTLVYLTRVFVLRETFQPSLMLGQDPYLKLFHLFRPWPFWQISDLGPVS